VKSFTNGGAVGFSDPDIEMQRGLNINNKISSKISGSNLGTRTPNRSVISIRGNPVETKSFLHNINYTYVIIALSASAVGFLTWFYYSNIKESLISLCESEQIQGVKEWLKENFHSENSWKIIAFVALLLSIYPLSLLFQKRAAYEIYQKILSQNLDFSGNIITKKRICALVCEDGEISEENFETNIWPELQKYLDNDNVSLAKVESYNNDIETETGWAIV
jgi:hypothetical protein